MLSKQVRQHRQRVPVDYYDSQVRFWYKHKKNPIGKVLDIDAPVTFPDPYSRSRYIFSKLQKCSPNTSDSTENVYLLNFMILKLDFGSCMKIN